jgi:hypothetical protein
MRPGELILVSVGDHVVEPADLFDRRTPMRGKGGVPPRRSEQP